MGSFHIGALRVSPTALDAENVTLSGEEVSLEGSQRKPLKISCSELKV